VRVSSARPRASRFSSLARVPSRRDRVGWLASPSGAPPLGHGETQEGVVAKEGGVAVVRPSLGSKQKIGQQQLPERVLDPLGVSPVGEDIDQQSPVAEPVGQIPEQERPRIAAQALGPGLHPDAAVEFRLEERKLGFTHGVCWGRYVDGRL